MEALHSYNVNLASALICRSAIVLAIAVSGFATSPVTAATQGKLGASSTGTAVVSIAKVDRVLITGMSDIALGPWSNGDSDSTGTTLACVYSSTGRYRVTAFSVHTEGSSFRLSNGAEFIDYSVEWKSPGESASLGAGQAFTGLTGDATSLTCAGAQPVSIVVKVGAGEMERADTGLYSDTLTVLVAPE